VPADLDALLAKCLDPDPSKRYESAAQLCEDLSRFLEDRPMRHIGERLGRRSATQLVRRNRYRLTTVGLMLTLVLCAASLLWTAQRHRRQEAGANANEDNTPTTAELERERRQEAERALELERTHAALEVEAVLKDLINHPDQKVA